MKLLIPLALPAEALSEGEEGVSRPCRDGGCSFSKRIKKSHKHIGIIALHFNDISQPFRLVWCLCLLGTVPVCLFSQTEIKKIDLALSSTYKYWMNNMDKYDSLEPLFRKQINQALLQPVTFEESLDSLSRYIDTCTSPDKKIKFYSWDDLGGGSWHTINCVAQFKNTQGKLVVQSLNSGTEMELGGYTDSGIYKTYVVYINKTKHYLTIGSGTHGSGQQHQVVQVFRLTSDSLVRCKTCFPGAEYLAIEYPRSKRLNLTFDPVASQLSYDEVKEMEGFSVITGKKITLKLVNGVFVKQ